MCVCRKDAERLGDELSMQRMKSLSESQRALELERKLFSAERAHKQSQSDNIKLQVKVEELRLKYEPNGKLAYIVTFHLVTVAVITCIFKKCDIR